MGKAENEDEHKGLGKAILRLMFSHVGLFFLVAAYAVGGAYMFIALEEPAERERFLVKRQKALYVNDSIQYLAELFWHYQEKNFTAERWNKEVTANLEKLAGYVVEVTSEDGYDGTVDGWDYDWDLPKSILFTISIMTTIGYGHISPKTWEGRLVLIIYSIIGIPLLLIFLANIGDSMASSLKYCYSRCCCRWCRSRRKKSEWNSDIIPKGERLVDEEVGKEEYMPTAEVAVPIMLTLVIIAVYLVFGAVLFKEWEGWDMITASYFAFVTLTTIGFGDYVPGNSFLDVQDGFGSAMKMVVTVMYCIIGMALVSMAINLMQEQLVNKIKWFAREIGMTSNESNAPSIEQQRKAAKLREYRLGQMATPSFRAAPVPSAKMAGPRSATPVQPQAKEDTVSNSGAESLASDMTTLPPPSPNPGDTARLLDKADDVLPNQIEVSPATDAMDF